MAFTLPLTINGEAQAAAYVKATIARCDTQRTVVQLQTWTSQASRTNGGQSVPDNWLPNGFSSLEVFATDLNLQASNPIDYAYKSLEASGEFPDATWNV
jgi:hypothetical protein